MIRRGPLLLLGVAVLTVFALTRLDFHAKRTATEEVLLGIEFSQDSRAQAVDLAVLSVIEEGAFGQELRLRLGRSATAAEISPFRMDVCEVSQGNFERFVAWLGERDANQSGVLGAIPESSSTGNRVAGLMRSPASGVDFLGAETYCRLLGGRLPWAEEWEAAASGQEGRLYPWGDDFDDDSWPHRDALRNASQACGSHPSRATPGGIHDMAGNVMEWSRSIGSEDGPGTAAHGAPPVRVRGRAVYALNAAWLEIEPETRSHHLGFRCVYEGVPPSGLPWGGQGPVTVAVRGGPYALGLPTNARLAGLATVLPNRQLRSVRGMISDPQSGERSLRVGRCEVTRGEYRLFLADPLVRFGLFSNESEPPDESYVPTGWEQQMQAPGLPVTGINWWAADAFARWAGGRLPEVVEWELLAAGSEGRVYPWGNDYIPGAAVAGDTGGSVSLCGAGSQDETESGILDLAGNVSEWTRSVAVDRGGYAMWVQGGNWVLPGLQTTRSVFGRLVPLGHRSQDIGLRVVYDRADLIDGKLAWLADLLAGGAGEFPIP